MTPAILSDFIASPPWAILTPCLLGLIVLYTRGVFSKNGRYPPGPKPHPFVGHVFQVPATKAWRYFEDLGKKYGPIVRLSLAGNEMVILNDAGDAEELLGRRSTNYSSRKPLIYAGKYQSHNNRILLLPYGEALKNQRAALHQIVSPQLISSYENQQELEAIQLLFDMLTRPKEAQRNVQRYSAALGFSLAYGKRISDDDEDLCAVLSILDGFIADCYPGAHLVDAMPILDILPNFLAPWRIEAMKKHEAEMKLFIRLIMDVKARMDLCYDSEDCFTARLWKQKDELNLDVVSLAYLAASTFEAGTDTTTAAMSWFLVAMIVYPDTLKKAQAELDALLGDDCSTMPSFAHINDLPYCVALAKEMFRWMPPGPGGFPHYSDLDDEYKGYKIKGKTMVIPNIWAMQRNEIVYPEASKFNPDRFMRSGVHLEHDSMTEGHYAFGFGRRICPGSHLAVKTVWIAIVQILWAFNIGPDLDASGKPITIDLDACTSGITSKPHPHPMRISPRSARHADTICKAWNAVQLT